jgi:hypothetical protein
VFGVLLFLPMRETKYFLKQRWTQNRERAPIGQITPSFVPLPARAWPSRRNSGRSANVRFGARSGLKSDITALPKVPMSDIVRRKCSGIGLLAGML